MQTLLKPLSSGIAIGSGGPFGAEGPIIMTGGALGSLLRQYLHITGGERKALLVAGARCRNDRRLWHADRRNSPRMTQVNQTPFSGLRQASGADEPGYNPPRHPGVVICRGSMIRWR
jgi:Voltage gated chloride channel